MSTPLANNDYCDALPETTFPCLDFYPQTLPSLTDLPPRNPRAHSAKAKPTQNRKKGANKVKRSRASKSRSRRNTLLRKPEALPEDLSESVASVNCDSESVRTRINRIQSNYVLLDQLLTDLEARVPFLDDEKSSNPKKPR